MGKGKALKGFIAPLVDDLLRVPARQGGRAGREVMDSVLHRHRAVLRRAELDRFDKRLDDMARQRGLAGRADLPRADRYRIDGRTQMNRARGKGADADEIELQRKAYEDGMNSQTVDQTLQRLSTKPRRPPSSAIRNEARDKLAREGQRDLIREGYTPEQARDMARAYADETFPRGGTGANPEQVTHNPDMHLGGDPNATTHGDGRVNNAFGSMGPDVRSDYERYLRQQQSAGRGDHLVNVELIV